MTASTSYAISDIKKKITVTTYNKATSNFSPCLELPAQNPNSVKRMFILCLAGSFATMLTHIKVVGNLGILKFTSIRQKEMTFLMPSVLILKNISKSANRIIMNAQNLPPLCDTCFKYFTGFFLTFLETIIPTGS